MVQHLAVGHVVAIHMVKTHPSASSWGHILRCLLQLRSPQSHQFLYVSQCENHMLVTSEEIA